jgi:hypothetical protein
MDAVEAFRKQLDGAGIDVLRELVKVFAERLMAEEAEVICGAGYGERSESRVNRRNGYRERTVDTRVGTIDLAIPRLREGSYFPGWLLEPRRRAERALVQVVAECYVKGVSTRRVDGLVKTLGIEHISKSRASEMAAELDATVQAFRNRPLDAGPYTYVWIDALALKVREAGRIQSTAALVATGVNAAGCREILGLEVVTSEDGAGWTAFLPRPRRPWPLRGSPGDLRRASGLGRCDRLDASGGVLAKMQDPLPSQPARQGAEVRGAVRGDARTIDLRPARLGSGLGPVPPRGRAAR